MPAAARATAALASMTNALVCGVAAEVLLSVGSARFAGGGGNGQPRP